MGRCVSKVKRYYPIMHDKFGTMKPLNDSQLCLDKFREAHAAGPQCCPCCHYMLFMMSVLSLHVVHDSMLSFMMSVLSEVCFVVCVL